MKNFEKSFSIESNLYIDQYKKTIYSTSTSRKASVYIRFSVCEVDPIGRLRKISHTLDRAGWGISGSVFDISSHVTREWYPLIKEQLYICNVFAHWWEYSRIICTTRHSESWYWKLSYCGYEIVLDYSASIRCMSSTHGDQITSLTTTLLFIRSVYLKSVCPCAFPIRNLVTGWLYKCKITSGSGMLLITYICV